MTHVVEITPIVYENIAREGMVRFAVIGDYGNASAAEKRVAEMVNSWQPDFIITTGDNNYDAGSSASFQTNVGQYYGDYIDVKANRFFPSLGNHDWSILGLRSYFKFFPISDSEANTQSSGNERYYDFIQGPVHLFAIDSDSREPHGATVDSAQAAWLEAQLTASTTPWQVVYFHHPPYSSGRHGSIKRMQWPFKEWGADVVLSGHDHTYERLVVDGLPYFVNGLGGRPVYLFKTAVFGSQVRFNGDHGAMLVQANDQAMILEFFAVRDRQRPVDRLVLMQEDDR